MSLFSALSAPSSRQRCRRPNEQDKTAFSGNNRDQDTRGHCDSSRHNRATEGASAVSEDEPDPITYWCQYERWPRSYFEAGGNMQNILAQKRTVSSRSGKSSDAASATESSNTQSVQKSREQKSAQYRQPQYEHILATKGVLMTTSPRGVTSTSKDWCKGLLEQEQTPPEGTLFRDDLFALTCENIRIRNETRVIRDIALLIVPSAELLTVYGNTHLQCLIDSVNEGLNNSIPVTKTRPQPDYAVGFRHAAFTQQQLDRMEPFVGDVMDKSYFMGTWYMFFPFLTCEIKCGASGLDVADRQNAHSTAIAVRAVVELFRMLHREQEVHREILAFSISHDNSSVRIYGHYAEIDGSKTIYYRHRINSFDFTNSDGKERWTAYKFTKNVYDNWMPMHFKRICSAIDQIPPDISFSMSGLSQDFDQHSMAESSAASGSGLNEAPAATPDTSVTEGGVFKRPRLEHGRPGRE